jgi:fucose permease
MIPSRFLAGIVKTDMKKVIAGLSVLITLSAAGAMLIPNAAAKMVMFALCGFGCGPIWPILMSAAVQDHKGTAGPAVGIMMSFSGLGGTALPLIAAVAIDATNRTSAAFYLSAAAALVMLAMYRLSLKKRSSG